mmetsp:Transcript_10590/g.23513  ORF Transcript_10590/g.23513 Transcript_10590/m.23513 type:complete len:160 (-) Transcript_10590:141-620(-)
MFYITEGYVKPLNNKRMSAIPDILFGFSNEDIQQLMFQEWGENERQAYVLNSWIDLVIYMEAYTIVLGTLLYYLADKNHWDPNRVCLLALPTLLFDFTETTLMQQGARVGFISEQRVRIASCANQLKWSTAAGIVIMILYARVTMGRHSGGSSKASKQD